MKRPSRINFIKIRDAYKKRGVDNVRLTQSSLFLTQNIDAAKANYNFEVLETNTGAISDEIRLNINDEFIITHAGIFLVGSFSSSGLPGVFTPFVLTTAPIEQNGASGDLDALYSGTMKIGVNNIIYVEKWDLRKHQQRQRTQFASFIAGVPTATLPSIESDMDGMISVEPMVTLSGAKKNDISIQLPRAFSPRTFSMVSQNAETITFNVTRIGLKLFGLNAQNASKFQ